jgi:hypothetical protein
MAIRIELWIDNQLVDGAEQWWDDIEASLPEGEGEASCPMLDRVDPYGDVLLEPDEMRALAVEARRFLTQAPERVRTFLEKLAELCDKGGLDERAELRFLGD